jgi:hypothetical protein
MLGGASMLIAALLVLRVQDVGAEAVAVQTSTLAAAAD